MADKKRIIVNVFFVLTVLLAGIAALFLFFLMPVIHSKFAIFHEYGFLWPLFYILFIVLYCFVFFKLIIWLLIKFVYMKIIAWIDRTDPQRKIP